MTRSPSRAGRTPSCAQRTAGVVKGFGRRPGTEAEARAEVPAKGFFSVVSHRVSKLPSGSARPRLPKTDIIPSNPNSGLSATIRLVRVHKHLFLLEDVGSRWR